MTSPGRYTVQTSGQGDAHDITKVVSDAVRVRSGVVTVFVVGSTAALPTIEFEPGAIADVNAVFERLAPRDGEDRHHERWGDDNGSSHVGAAMLGPSLTIPIVDSELTLGTWQQILLLEFDTQPRTREIVIQVIQAGQI